MFGRHKISHYFLALAFLLVAAAAQAEPAIWVIKQKKATIYLFGTIHLLRPETVWNVPKIKKATAESRELWLEVVLDPNDSTSMNVMGKYGFDSTKRLSEALSAEQRERLVKTADQYTFPMELIDQMRPWYAGLTLTLMPLLKAGYNPNAGVEEILRVRAQIAGRKVAGLETLEEQIKLLSELSEADQIDFLMAAISNTEEGVAYFKKMEQAWSEGDLKALETIFADEMKNEAPMAYQGLIVDRNKRWSEQIAKMLQKPGVKFIAVGTGHLVGPDSVQAQLARQGIKAKRY